MNNDGERKRLYTPKNRNKITTVHSVTKCRMHSLITILIVQVRDK